MCCYLNYILKSAVPVWLAKHEHTHEKKEIRILFITRMDERLTKKIHFVWPRQAHLYIFFSLGPLFIRDRLKYCVCKLGAFKQTFILHIFLCRVVWYFLGSFFSLSSSQQFYPLWKGDRGKFFMHTYFHFSDSHRTYGKFSFSFANFTCFHVAFPLQWTGKNIANYHVVLDI